MHVNSQTLLQTETHSHTDTHTHSHTLTHSHTHIDDHADTIYDTQWLFPRDRIKGRGRAYPDENPPDSSPSYDGVQRVWKKSDPATTGEKDDDSGSVDCGEMELRKLILEREKDREKKKEGDREREKETKRRESKREVQRKKEEENDFPSFA